MKKFNSILILLILIIGIASCSKNNDEPNIPPPTSSGSNLNLGPSISRDFIGQILDESSSPIIGANVKIAGITKITDVNGIFIIKNASVNEQMAYVTATKSGYLDGSRSLVPTTGTNNLKIILYSDVPTQTINSGSSSTVTLTNGTKVTFDGVFKTDSGTAYSGSVNVILKHLTTDDTKYEQKMPGMLLAQNTAGAPKALQTYGMINVVVKGAAGQNLQITNPASIEMTIPNKQLATAPTSIPLWHFDETLGYWKEDGTATRIGNTYKGTVSHFSWWNVDQLSDFANLCVKIVNPAGMPLSNVRVDILAANYTYSSPGITNINGEVCGLVPANLALTVNVFNNCGIAQTTTIAALTSNSTFNAPNIVLATSSTLLSTNVQGNIVKCDGTSVTNGYLYSSNGAIIPINNGTISFATTYCNTATGFTLQGYDGDTMQTTGVLNFNFTPTNTNLGNINACIATSEYINYKLDSNLTKTIFAGISAQKFASSNVFEITGAIGSENILIHGTSITPGIFTTSNGFYLEGSFIPITFGIFSTTTNTMIFNLSSFGSVGQYIDFTFNGTYTESGVVHTLVGTAHVKRDS